MPRVTQEKDLVKENTVTMQGKILKCQCHELITEGHRVHVMNMCFRQSPATGQKRKYFKDSRQAHHRFLALKMPEKHPKVFGKHSEIQYFYSDYGCLITNRVQQAQTDKCPNRFLCKAKFLSSIRQQ